MILELTLALSLRAQTSTRTIDVLDLTAVKIDATASRPSRERAWDMLQAASDLEGLVNRNRARLYVLFCGRKGLLDRYWLGKLREGWLKEYSTNRLLSLGAAISRFRRSVRGIVVWDERVPATSDVADTVAGVDDLLPVRYDSSSGSLYRWLTKDPNGPRFPIKVWLIRPNGKSLFTGLGVIPGTETPSTGSAKCDAYVWAAEKYLRRGKCGPGWMGYYPDATWLAHPHQVPLERTLLTNHDFFVAKRAFFFDLDPWSDEEPIDDPKQPLGTDERTLLLLLRKEYDLSHGGVTHVGGFTPWDQKYTDFTGGHHGGVATEWRYAEILSCFNAFMDADAPGLNAMANASFFTHQPLRARYMQNNLPSKSELKRAGLLEPDGHVERKSFVAIYVGDYDSAAWLYRMMPTVWDDPARGSVPLGWAFDPEIESRFPTGLIYARHTATKNDFFVAGDSGAGYLNPGYLTPPRKWSGLPSGLAAWERFCSRLYRRWDLGITGFVIDGNAPAMSARVQAAYAHFSPLGVVAQKVPLLSLVDGAPFMRMSSDLPHDPSAAANLISHSISSDRARPTFSIFRTVLWTPTEQRSLCEDLKALRPDIEIVDPYTLMLLAKIELSLHRANNATPFQQARP